MAFFIYLLLQLMLLMTLETAPCLQKTIKSQWNCTGLFLSSVKNCILHLGYTSTCIWLKKPADCEMYKKQVKIFPTTVAVQRLLCSWGSKLQASLGTKFGLMSELWLHSNTWLIHKAFTKAKINISAHLRRTWKLCRAV